MILINWLFAAFIAWVLWPMVMTIFFPTLLKSGHIPSDPTYWHCLGLVILINCFSPQIYTPVKLAIKQAKREGC